MIELVILRDAIAIALMFCWAGIFSLLAILFKIQHRRLKDKLEELKGVTTEYRRDCFSLNWEQKQIKRKSIGARSIYIMIPMGVATLIAFVILLILPSLGYAMFISYLGLPAFLDNALEMYRYSRAVRKEPLEKLQDKDREYIEYAIEVLAKRRMTYSILSFMFFVSGLFVPQLFNLLPYIMATYFSLAFLLVEKFGIGVTFVILIPFIALPVTLALNYRWTIHQTKRLIGWIISKLRRSES